MNINWTALGSTAAVSLGVTVAVVALFALGVAALSRREIASGEGGGAAPLAAATACFTACAAAVAYGLYLIAFA